MTCALAIDGAPQIDHASINLEVDLAVRFGTMLAQIHRDHGSEMVQPPPKGPSGDHDAEFRQQLFGSRKLRVNRT
jgi:hypothetical protein